MHRLNGGDLNAHSRHRMAEAVVQPLHYSAGLDNATVSHQYNNARGYDAQLYTNRFTGHPHASTSRSHRHTVTPGLIYPINPLNGNCTSLRRLRELQQQVHIHHANNELPLSFIHSILGQPNVLPLPNTEQICVSSRRPAAAPSPARDGIDQPQRCIGRLDLEKEVVRV